MTDSEMIKKNKWKILIITITFTFMACLDASIVNVALPTISDKLGTSLANIAWVVTIYLITITALIIFFGKIADLTGKSRMFIFGVVGFIVGSLICGISNSFVVLLIARVIQAIGAAAGMATTQGIIVETFAAGERGRALGISGSSVALGNMAGPVLGGLIVSFFSWHYIFLINIPIGIIVLIFARIYLPKDSAKLPHRKHLDVPGFVLFALTMTTLFAAISEGEFAGYGSALIISLFAVFVISIVFFIMREKKAEKYSMLDLSIFKNGLFSLSIFCAFVSFFVIASCTLLLPYYLQELMGLSPLICGLIMLASPLVMSLVAPLSGHASDKMGSEFLTFIGLIIVAISLVLSGIFYNQNTTILVITLIIGIMAAGNAMFQSPNTSLIMSTVPKNKLGIAGSINALARNAGMVCGVSLSSVWLWSIMSKKMGFETLSFIPSGAGAFVFALHWVFIIEAIICGVGIVLTGVRIWGARRREIAK